MPKWSKDAKEFEVNVHYNKEKGSQIRLPKPILDKMENPEKVKFVINGNTVKIVPTETTKTKVKVKVKRIKKGNSKVDN